MSNNGNTRILLVNDEYDITLFLKLAKDATSGRVSSFSAIIFNLY
jgi:hypothetical protein